VGLIADTYPVSVRKDCLTGVVISVWDLGLKLLRYIAEYQSKIKQKFSPFSRQHSPCIPLSGIFQDFIEPVRTIPASEIRSSA
jgi:hypothetical protein